MLHFHLLRNVLSNWVRTVTGFLVGFVLTPLLFHYLQPSNYAILVLALAIEALLESFDLGMPSAVIRFVSELGARGSYVDLNRMVTTVFYLLLAFGVIGEFGLIVLSPLIAAYFQMGSAVFSPGTVVIPIVGFTVVFQLPCSVLRALLEGFHSFHLANAVEICCHMFYGICLLIFLHAGYGLPAIATLIPATALLRLVGMLAMGHRTKARFWPKLTGVDFASLREIRNFAFLTFSQDTLTRMYDQADTFLAAKLLPLPQLAILAVANRIPGALTRIAQQGIWVGYPIVSSAAVHKDRQAVERFMIVGSRNVLAFLLPCSAALVIWAREILCLWVGPDVLSGVSVFRILIVFAIFASLEEIPLIALYGLGMLGFAIRLTASMLAVAVTFGAWGCVVAGLSGLAFTFTSLQAIATMLLCKRALAVTGVPTRRWLLKAVVPTTIATFPALIWFVVSYGFLSHNLVGLLASVTTGLLLYMALLTILVTGLTPLCWSVRIKRVLFEID